MFWSLKNSENHEKIIKKLLTDLQNFCKHTIIAVNQRVVREKTNLFSDLKRTFWRQEIFSLYKLICGECFQNFGLKIVLFDWEISEPGIFL